MGDMFRGWTILEWVLMILYVGFLILAFPFLLVLELAKPKRGRRRFR